MASAARSGSTRRRSRQSASRRAKVLGVKPPLRLARPALGQRRPLLAALERVQVVHVLVEDPQSGVAVVRRAVAGHDRLRLLHERRQAGQRGAVVGERTARRDHRQLHVRQVVARHQQPERAREHRTAVGRVALRRVQLELASRPGPAGPGTGSACTAPEAQRRRPRSRSARRRRRAARAGPPRARRAAAARWPPPLPAAGPERPGGRAGGRSRRGWRAARPARSPPGPSSGGSASSSSGK